MHFAKEDRN